ncbi:MAG TPA: oligosaccharide flippase family protein [Terriglobia bacterium]|nr:oligosaccharide flippase family protein [Terriglobia bacterium]
MSIRVLAAKNAFSNWTLIAVMTVVSVLLAPFVLHRLGDSAYGLYYLIMTITGYYGLLDLGMATAIVKYVAEYTARNDEESLNCLVNTAIFCYSILSVVIAVLTWVGSIYVDSLFHISPGFLRDARLLFLITGFGVAGYFPLGVFNGILGGLQKFYVTSPMKIVCTLLRAGLVVYFLEIGYGLLALAIITVGVNVGVYAGSCVFFAIHSVRLQWGRRYIRKDTFKMIARYAIPNLAAGIPGLLRTEADNAIIGVSLSAAAITYYSIGAKLVEYLGRLVNSLGTLFIPMASQFDAAGETHRMRRLLIDGNRVCAFLAFPFAVVMVILGKPIIAVWMGQRYVASSYVVLVILVIPTALWFSQSASTRILYGINEHKWLAKILWFEGLSNLALSIILVHRIGITGVAIGTAIPLAVLSIFFVAPHLARLLKVSLTEMLIKTYLPPLALCVPLAAVLFLLRRLFPTPSIPTLFLQLAGGAVVYGVIVLWLFFTREPLGIKVWGRVAQSLPKPFGR